jgi:hypothetical protein
MDYSTGSPKTQSPYSYHRYPVEELRRLPVRDNPRCETLSYELTAAPGMKNSHTGRPRTHGHGAVRLFGGFIAAVCVAQDAGEWFLEAQIAPFDTERNGRATMEFSPQILADIYRVVQQHQIAGQARSYGRGEGRN